MVLLNPGLLLSDSNVVDADLFSLSVLRNWLYSVVVLVRPATGVEVALASHSRARLMEEPTPVSCR